MRVRFLGTRGSCPCPGPGNVRYGGNTAAVSLEADPAHPILFDLGTGVTQVAGGRRDQYSALVTHLHFDHVQGLPFFPPVHTPGCRLDVYAPRPESGPLGQAMADLIRPPYFPLALEQFLGDVRFIEVSEDRFALGEVKVAVEPVPHKGVAVGYRVEHRGTSVAYVSDHQAPPGLDTVAGSVLRLCEGADLLIHDAQYTEEEFAAKADWGHCTVDYAVLVARAAGVRRLALFHHDPSHDDEEVDRLLAHARRLAASALEVVAAYEGMVISL